MELFPFQEGSAIVYIYRDAYSYGERFCQPPDSCVTLSRQALVLSYVVRRS